MPLLLYGNGSLAAWLFLEPLLSLKVTSPIFGALLTPYIVKNTLMIVLELLSGSGLNRPGQRMPYTSSASLKASLIYTGRSIEGGL